LNFEEIRRYLPGDDIRNIDWKVTARVQKPHVRVYTEEKDRPALLIVDQRMSMFFGSQGAMKSVRAAEAAALAAWRILSSGDRVGAIVFSDEEVTEIRPHRSQERVMQILRTVVKLNHALNVAGSDPSEPRPSANAANLNVALQSALRLAKHDFLVVLISDGFGADDESVRLFTLLCEHNDVMTVFIYDPLEAQLPNVGRVVTSEAELQLEVNTSDTTLRERFRSQFEERLEWIRHVSRVRSVPLLPIETGTGVAEQVRKLLGHAPPSGR
jgi:uncharacterized protein (DUF58 family)